MSKTKLLIPILLIASFTSSCSSNRAAELNEEDLGTGLERGYLAPDFTLAVYNQRQTLQLKEAIEGKKLVLLNFWASWCGPCRIELPQLDRLQKKYAGHGFQVLAINVDRNKRAMEIFLKSNSFSFPVLYDLSQSVHTRYSIYALPSNFILDGEGRIIQVIQGYTPLLEPMLEQMIRDLNS